MIVSDRTYGEVMERITRCRDLTWDLETTGLRPYQGDRIFSVAVEADGEASYFPFRHEVGVNLEEGRLPELLLALTTPDKCLLGFNSVRFDAPMAALEDETVARRLLLPGGTHHEDVIIDALLANENEPSFSLENLGLKYLGGDAAEKHKRKAELVEHLKRANPGVTKMKGRDGLLGKMATLPPELVAPYAEGDVLDTRALKRKYADHHEAWGLTALARELYDYARLLARAERAGVLLDQAMCRERIARIDIERAQLLLQIQAATGPTFNPQSPIQCVRFFGTKDAEAQSILRTKHPLGPSVVMFRRLGKMKTTYYESLLEKCDPSGRVHPQLNLTRDPNDRGGTKSGRLSCSNPNLQNQPKRAKDWFAQVRDVFLAGPGRRFSVADWERAEMWVGGSYSGDQSLFEAYHAGRDLYVELSEKTETDRQGAKIDWLAIQYGARGRKLSEMHNWPFVSIQTLERRFGKPAETWGNPEWRTYMDQKGPRVVQEFFELCPGIKAKMKELEELAARVGSMRLWTGRVIHFDGMKTPPFVAWNRLVQGGVGEKARVAMQHLELALDAETPGAVQILQVHDELAVDHEEHQGSKVRPLMRECMTEGFPFQLKPRIELFSGESYGQLTKEAA